MKKIITFVLAFVLVCSMTACSEKTVSGADSGGKPTSGGDIKISASSVEELEAIVEKDVNDTIEGLNSEYEKLIAGVDTYDKYVASVDKVKAFYEKIYTEHENLCIRMREYSIAYAELVINSGESSDEKYDAIEGLYDCIYDKAGDNIYDGIYDKLMDNMYDTFYNGILEDGYDLAPYDEWSSLLSDEYEMWSDGSSDIYEDWSDTLSDIYSFWSDVSGDLFSNEEDRVKEEIENFKEDVAKLKEE